MKTAEATTYLVQQKPDLNNRLFVKREFSQSLNKRNIIFNESYYVVRNGKVLAINTNLVEEETWVNLRHIKFECADLGEYSPEKIPAQRAYMFSVADFKEFLSKQP